MNDVTNTVSDTADNTASVAKGFMSDMTQFQFYKNPVFIGFCIYLLVVIGTYAGFSEANKNNYVFSNKFRSNQGDINWSSILFFPYDPSSSALSLIKVLTTPPIIWYLFIFSVFFTSIIDTSQDSRKTYFYSILASWLVIVILFAIHSMIFNFIIKPENVDVELQVSTSSEVTKTYIEFYRTQWLLLVILSPIYVILLLYSIRKLKIGSSGK